MTRVAPNTQILCVTACGNEVFLITTKLEVAKYMSLRALVDCEVSNNFVGRQSLDNSKLKFIEREISPTMMTLRLATGTFVTVMKGVVEITCTMKEAQYDVIVGLPWFRKYEPQVS